MPQIKDNTIWNEGAWATGTPAGGREPVGIKVQKETGFIDGVSNAQVKGNTIKNVYQGIGAVVVDDQWSDANALKKEETQSKRRASYEAIAHLVGAPQYDEDADKGEFTDASFHEVVEAPTSVVKFMQRVTLDEFEKVMGYTIDNLEHSQLAAAWGAITAARKQGGA